MLNGQVWKNGSRIAQINTESHLFKAAVFKLGQNKLSFIEFIDVKDEKDLLDIGFRPTDDILIIKEKAFV